MFNRIVLSALATAVAGVVSTASAATLFNDDYSTFTPGDLVGQNGYTQLSSSATVPVQVSGGKAVIPLVAPTGTGGASVDNQDVQKVLTTIPESGTTGTDIQVYQAFVLNVQSTTTNPSYFAGFLSGAFANGRIAALDNGAGGYVLETRVTGQAGAPYAVGTTSLSLNQDVTIIEQINLNGGAGNDTVQLYVNPTSSDLSSQTPYATASVGTGTDPTGYQGLVYSQFANATIGESGLTVSRAAAADTFAEAYAAVPEPASLGILGLGVIASLGRRAR